MQEASAWAKAELKHRRVSKNSAHGIGYGINNEYIFNYLLYKFILFSLIFEWEKYRLSAIVDKG